MPDLTLDMGDVIIAPPRMQDPRFTKTVIMLTHRRDGAAHGLCLNRPSTHTLQDLTAELDVVIPQPIDLYWGGPVNPQTIWMLHSSEWSLTHTVNINSAWSMTSHRSMFDHLADGDCPQRYIITFGFCGWARGQLEAELEGQTPFTPTSSWLTWHQPDQHVLEVDPRELWRVGCEQVSHQAVSRWMA